MRSLCLVLAIFSFPSFARWATPKDVGTVLERYIIDVEVNKDGSFTHTYEQIRRIQTEEGKINTSLIEIEYNAFSDKVELIKAATLNGKSETPVAPTAIEDRDKGESRDYDPVKVKSLAYPQVRIGSRLFLKYKVTTAPPIIPDRWSWSFDVVPGVLIEKMSLKVHSQLPLYHHLYDPPKMLKVKATKHRLTADLAKINPGQVVGEKDSFLHPERFTHLVVTSEPKWGEYFSPLVRDFDAVLKEELPADIKKELGAWKKGPVTEATIQKVMVWMSQHFRYLGDWRRVRGGVVPRHLAEIEKSRYGDCKDLSVLLVSILRNLGVKSQVALVERSVNAWINAPEEPMAYVGAFNHAIVRAELNGKALWLDPTNSVVSLVPFADIAGKNSWVLSSDTKKFDRIDPIAPNQYVYEEKSTHTFEPNGNVKVDMKADYQNMAAFRLAYSFLSNSREKMFYDILEYYADGADVTASKFIKMSSVERKLEDLSFNLAFWTPSVTYRTPLGHVVPLKDGFLSGAFYETKDRESDLMLAETPLIHRSWRTYKNVKMGGEALECDLKSPWVDVKREANQNGSDVMVFHEAVVKTPAIQKKDYGTKEFQALQAQARKCFYRTGLIFQTQ